MFWTFLTDYEQTSLLFFPFAQAKRIVVVLGLVDLRVTSLLGLLQTFFEQDKPGCG